ncbi:MAG: hypothetical protein EXS08_12215 [Planctomycetes bacterium]|nr:hypothetical protein [Planctomycetota bacterium]
MDTRAAAGLFLLPWAGGSLLALLGAGCGKAEYQPRAVAGAYFDFASELHCADRWSEVDMLRVSEYSARAHLAHGWSLPENSATSPYPGLWAESARPSLRFWIVEPGPRTVAFRALGGRLAEPRPPTPAHFTLNGAPAGEFSISESITAIELTLPVELQHAGLNELAFEIQGGIRPSVELEGNADARFLSGYFSDLTVNVLDPEQRRRCEQRAALVPGGSRVAADGATLEQASGSVIRYALALPPGAVFESELACASGSEDALFRVRLRDDEGTDELLVDEAVEGGDRPHLVHADLGRYAGRDVELEFSLEALEEPRAALAGRWLRPVLLAEAPAPVATAPDVALALGRARERLARAPVIVLLMDAFNPDFMSAYGGRAGLTPNLDRLALEGKRFEHAFTSASYTIAAVGSVLTSAPAWQHGAWNQSLRLLDSVETWGERFQRAGYRTGAIVCSGNGSASFGYQRGFEQFLEVFRGLPFGRPIAAAKEVLAGVEELLAADDGRPLMLWFHLLEPHEPYGAREPWGQPLDPNYEGSIRGDTETLVAIRERKLEPSARDLQHLQALYEEGVAYVDHLVGRIRERLEQQGLWQDAVVVLLSDHGEAFLAHHTDEYVGISHGLSTFSDMTHIPLVVRLPEGSGLDTTPTRALVANIDVFATVADLVGVPLPPIARGMSFAPTLFGAANGGRRRLVMHSYPRDQKNFLPELALIREPYKYVVDSGVREALYDLSRGLFESDDLLQQKPVLAAVLRQALRRTVDFDPLTGKQPADAVQSTQLDDEVQRQLEALGYGR